MYNKNKMTQEQLRMQMLAGIITESQYKAKLEEYGGGDTESDRRYVDSARERERRESATPKDDWGNDIDGYIKYLMNSESYKWETDEKGNRDLKTLRGFESIENIFNDLDDKTSYTYRHAKGRGYLDWMLKVRERYNELKKSGKIKDIDKEEAERKEKEYWTSYYDSHPQFKRPEGY